MSKKQPEEIVPRLPEILAEWVKEVLIEQQQMLAQAFRPILRPILEEISSTLASLEEELKRKLEPFELDAQEVMPVFKQAGFWFAPSMPLALLERLRQLKDRGELDPGTLKRVVLEYFRENDWAPLKEMVDGWAENPFFAPRMHIIRDALKAHIEARYTLSVPALLPQIEGVAGQIVGSYSSKSGEKVKMAVEKMPLDFLAHATREPLLLYIENMAYSWKDFREFDAWLEEGGWTGKQVLHRHAILHGVQTDYGSEENSLRAFLMLDALFDVSGWIEQSVGNHRERQSATASPH